MEGHSSGVFAISIHSDVQEIKILDFFKNYATLAARNGKNYTNNRLKLHNYLLTK